MFWTVLFAFLHHAVAFTLFAALVTELILLRDLTLANAQKVLVMDLVYGISAGVLLVVGLSRVFFFEKGAHYYFHNAAFHAKFGLFLLVGLASIFPTIEFLSWRKAIRQGQVPSPTPGRLKAVRVVVHAQLAGLLVILLCAAMMARGVGQFGN